MGEQWQLLGAEEKEPYETQALSGKERYTAELNQYKRTSKYKGYSEYLAEFKAKTAANNTGKRVENERMIIRVPDPLMRSRSEASQIGNYPWSWERCLYRRPEP